MFLNPFLKLRSCGIKAKDLDLAGEEEQSIYMLEALIRVQHSNNIFMPYLPRRHLLGNIPININDYEGIDTCLSLLHEFPKWHPMNGKTDQQPSQTRYMI